jgi:chromosome segregation ATPase
MDQGGPNDINNENGEGENPNENNPEEQENDEGNGEENAELDDEGGNEDMDAELENMEDGNENLEENHNDNPSGSGRSLSGQGSNNQNQNEENPHDEGEAEMHNTQSQLEESESQRVENESLYSYDENKDFPVFANKINKKLNEIISNYKKELKTLAKDIEEDTEMVKILKEHTASVENQVKNREKMVDEMTKNANMQSHTIEVIKRQIGKVKSQRKNLENEELTLQERFNTLQQNIAKANEKMDTYKLDMKNILEELEQWALAARQKEGDKLNIEKYYRHDELKVKDTMLQIERLTQDVNNRMHELEKEVTETQAAQIEMDKTTIELKNLQGERQELLDHLISTQDNIKSLSDDLRELCDVYYRNKVELGKDKDELDKGIKTYEDHLKKNKKTEEDIKQNEAVLSKTRENYLDKQHQFNELSNDIEIKKNELSALARELNGKTNASNYQKNEVEKKKKNLDEAKTEYNNKKAEIERNTKKYLNAKEKEEAILAQNNELNKKLKSSKEELEKTVNQLFEESKKLFELREKEANMIGDINNVISAKKNLKANILKLDNDINKQGELLYNVDFQIQLMERKVDWVQGKRTQEETNEINKKTEILEKTTSELAKKKAKFENSLIMINEDLRAIDTKLKTITNEKDKLTSIIEELELENMKCGQDLQKIVKTKEEVLVEHDLMKLDIKKIYDKLLKTANEVFEKENTLAQLELSIKEREREINVHKDLLIAERKSAEEQKHNCAIELTQKLIRAKNLKLKYESLINKTSKNEDGGEEKYSQAYYVIKTAQEKEELQRQGDEMAGKIAKCKKDLSSLKKTLEALQTRNDKLKKALILKQKGEVDNEKVKQLEAKVEKENKYMWEKKKELDNLNVNYQSNQQKMEEKKMQINMLQNNIENYHTLLQKQENESKKKEDANRRQLNRFNKLIRDSNIDIDNTDIGNEIKLKNEKIKNDFLKNSISILAAEIDEVKNIFSNEMQDFHIPSRPISMRSDASNASNHSQEVSKQMSEA